MAGELPVPELPVPELLAGAAVGVVGVIGVVAKVLLPLDPLPLLEPPVDLLVAGCAATIASSVDGGAASVVAGPVVLTRSRADSTLATGGVAGSMSTTRLARGVVASEEVSPSGALPGFCHTDSLVGFPRLGNSVAFTAVTAPTAPASAMPIKETPDRRMR